MSTNPVIAEGRVLLARYERFLLYHIEELLAGEMPCSLEGGSFPGLSAETKSSAYARVMYLSRTAGQIVTGSPVPGDDPRLEALVTP